MPAAEAVPRTFTESHVTASRARDRDARGMTAIPAAASRQPGDWRPEPGWSQSTGGLELALR